MRPMLRNADYRRRARSTLPRFVFDYVDGGAEDERGLLRNDRAFEAVQLVPGILRDTREIDLSREVFGRRWAAPVGISPMGFCGLVRPEGDVLLARAAAAQGLPFTLSTPSNSRLETVRASAPDAPQWMQLYVMEDRSIAAQIVRRARAARFEALVLTVDAQVSGYRERDVRNRFKLPFRPGPGTLWDLVTHPRWSLSMARSGAPGFVNLQEDVGAKSSPQAQAALLARTMDRGLTWDCIGWLRDLWDGPLLLKGVLAPADATRARDLGVDGIIVSNHGGRQLDAAPATLDALPRIVDVAAGRMPVFIDGGVRRGSDVAKALAVGATAAFVGRPAMWGLAAGGQAGVAAVLRGIVSELERTLILMGVTAVDQLNRTHLSPARAPG